MNDNEGIRAHHSMPNEKRLIGEIGQDKNSRIKHDSKDDSLALIGADYDDCQEGQL